LVTDHRHDDDGGPYRRHDEREVERGRAQRLPAHARPHRLSLIKSWTARDNAAPTENPPTAYRSARAITPPAPHARTAPRGSCAVRRRSPRASAPTTRCGPSQ